MMEQTKKDIERGVGGVVSVAAIALLGYVFWQSVNPNTEAADKAKKDCGDAWVPTYSTIGVNGGFCPKACGPSL